MLYHSIGTQTENNRPSYFDRPFVGNLWILQVTGQRYEKVPEGLPQNRAVETIRDGGEGEGEERGLRGRVCGEMVEGWGGVG